jgi:hypothetical protein
MVLFSELLFTYEPEVAITQMGFDIAHLHGTYKQNCKNIKERETYS